MKIIQVSVYTKYFYSNQTLVAENVSRFWANKIIKAVNNDPNGGGREWKLIVVDDDYELNKKER